MFICLFILWKWHSVRNSWLNFGAFGWICPSKNQVAPCSAQTCPPPEKQILHSWSFQVAAYAKRPWARGMSRGGPPSKALHLREQSTKGPFESRVRGGIGQIRKKRTGAACSVSVSSNGDSCDDLVQ